MDIQRLKLFIKQLAANEGQRFNCYYDLSRFNVGFGFGRASEFIDWKYIVSVDFGCISFWVYFVRRKK